MFKLERSQLNAFHCMSLTSVVKFKLKIVATTHVTVFSSVYGVQKCEQRS